MTEDPWNVPTPGRSSDWDPWNVQDPWANGADPWANDGPNGPWQRGRDTWQDAWNSWERAPRVCRAPTWEVDGNNARPQWNMWNRDRNPTAATSWLWGREERSVSPPRQLSPPRQEVPWGGWNQTVDMDDLPATPPHQGVWLEESWSQDPWTVTADGLADLLGANGIDRNWMAVPQLRFVPPPRMRHRGRHPYDDDESDSDDPDLLRALEESLRTAEAEEQSRVAADRDRQDRLSGQCVVCLEAKHGGAACCMSSSGSDSTSASASDTVTEKATHFICHECIPMYVGSELQNDDSSDRRLMERRAFGHCLRCPCSPMPLNCGGYLEERHVRPFLTTALWSQLQAASEADEKHLQWQKESRDNEDPEFLREALLRSMPNAVQCGRCHYGPIDHAGCEDLDAHHWQWQGNSQIQNQCPKCGWWAHSIESWPPWNGVICQ